MIPQLPTPAGPLLLLAALILLAIVIASALPTPVLPAKEKTDVEEEEPADTKSQPRRVWVVVNPTKPADLESFKTRVNRMCQAMTGHEAGWLETTIQDPGTGQAIEAISNDPLVVLAAGGDGTVRAVAAGMAHSKYPMGILPVGTGNLLARNLGLPFTLETALEIAVLGQDCDIDLAWLHAERVVVPSDLPAEGGLLRAANASSIRKLPEGVLEPRPDEYAYLVVAGIGFDGETMANTSAEMKKKVGWSAYILSGIKSLTSERMKATVTVYYPPGKTGPKQPNKKFSPIPKKTSESIRASKTIGHSDSPSQVVHTEENWQMSVLRARTVMLANVGDVLFLRLAPDAAIDDGMLDVVAVDTKGGIAGWISVAAKIVSQGIGLPVGNSKHGLGNIAFKQTNRARIDVNRAYPVQVDGDPVGTARTVVARTDPGALTMRIPSKTF